MSVVTTVIARTKVEGIHYWKGCHIEEVMYLKHPHRHLFHIEARRKVTHPDRDIEFIELSHNIRAYLVGHYWSTDEQCCNFNGMSCEMIAEELLNHFDLDYIEVNEDGEGGAIVEKR